MTPLLALELRRQRPILLRMAGLTVIVGIIFVLAGKRTASDLLAALIGSSLGVTLIVPMGIARDKLEGTLDFICSLPVEPRAIAASRFLAMALLATPWALGIGALSIMSPPPGSLGPGSIAVLAWLAMLLLGSCSIALFARFELEQLLGAPIVVLVILTVLLPRAFHTLLPGLDSEEARRLLLLPHAPAMLTLALTAGLGALGWIAFAMTRSGLAEYGPGSSVRGSDARNVAT